MVQSVPSPDLAVLGMEASLRWVDPLLPITLTTFDSMPQALKEICGVVLRKGNERGHLFSIEFNYTDVASVRLGLEGVTPVNITSFSIDYENGEYIRGLESCYIRKTNFAGFKARSTAYATSTGLWPFGMDTVNVGGLLRFIPTRDAWENSRLISWASIPATTPTLFPCSLMRGPL